MNHAERMQPISLQINLQISVDLDLAVSVLECGAEIDLK
jgi:hypothetical protein